MKILKEHKESAVKIFEANDSLDSLFVNKKGEFFTNENLASVSVKGVKKDFARIARASVIEDAEDDKDDFDHKQDETVVKGDGMILKCDDNKELVFTKIKDEVREPIQGDYAEFNDKPADGVFKFKTTTMGFKNGKLDKIKFEDGAVRSFFNKFLK
ncbi:MAG: hypothetical protein PSN34_06305 [Urechidicola sp.]|nr:hypothetical protein [Urechidicola sp.]